MYRNKILVHICILGLILALSGCSENTTKRTLYDMQKLAYQTSKIAEQINIQPALATTADSTRLKDAHAAIVDFFLRHEADPGIRADSAVFHDMGRLALRSQLALARYYSFHRNMDSVLAAYDRIGTVIPAGRDDIAGAALGRALTYRVHHEYDSTIAIYDRILHDYYPPLDYYERANNDVIAIPVDKIKLADVSDNKKRKTEFVTEALDYYERLKTQFPDYPQLAKTAAVHTSRVYAMIENWDEAIDELRSLKDSTGQTQIQSLVLIANIYSGAKKDLDKAIETYRQILSREPDSAIIGQTLLRTGVALCAQKKYTEGRKYFVNIKNNFRKPTRLLSQTQLFYAQSFKEENRWERALSELQWLMENYPYTDEAFRAARMIPEKFKSDGNDKLADIWYNRAIEFYQRATVNKQGQLPSLAAYSYLADMYQRLKRWNDAMETLNKIYSLAPRSRLAAKALYNAATIAFKQFNDTTMAQGFLDKLNTEFGTTDSSKLSEENTFTVESIE